MVGCITSKPEALETSGKKKYFKFKFETWNFRRINGEVKKLTAEHTVLCFNQLAQSFLETVAIGTRIHLTGELDYDRQGNAQVVVPQYVGDIGAMDAASEEKTTSEPVAAAKATSRPVTSAGLSSPMSRPATPASTPLAAKAGGGLGRLPLRKGNQTSNEGVDSNAGNYRETENSIKSTSKNIFLDSDGFDDAIPY
jgi:single-stranded DNA-binding protein